MESTVSAEPTQSAVLVTVDSLRRDGAPPPNGGEAFGDAVDAMARAHEVTPLNDTWAAAPYTALSFKSIFSGEQPLKYDGAAVNKRYASDRRYLPELLPDEVTTIGVTANITTSRHGEWQRGWDRLVDFTAEASDGDSSGSFGQRSLRHTVKQTLSSFDNLRRLAQFAYRLKNMHDGSLPFPDGDELVEAVESELADVDPPLFLWVHFMEPHTPWLPLDHPETASAWSTASLHSRLETDQRRLSEGDGRRLIELYRSWVTAAGEKVAKLFRTLDRYPWFDDSLRLLTADHGEELGEEGWFGHTHLGAPMSLCPNLTHVPAYICTPGVDVDPDTLVGHADVTPTLCEWFGVEPEAPAGESVFADERSERVFSEYEKPETDEYGVACLQDGWRYVRVEKDGELRSESFSAVGDARGSPAPELRDELIGAAEDRIGRRRDGTGRHEEVSVGTDVESRLEDLGYH